MQGPMRRILCNWEQQYWRAFESGTSGHPVMRAYVDTALKFGIPPEVMGPYFRSMKADLTVTRFPTLADLLYYMEGSALPVGRTMTYIVGVRPPHTVEDTLPHADSLSNAMQLSNFWRDVGQDYRIGRVYLPFEDMARFGVTEDDLARLPASLVRGPLVAESGNALDGVRKLREVYSGAIGYETGPLEADELAVARLEVREAGVERLVQFASRVVGYVEQGYVTGSKRRKCRRNGDDQNGREGEPFLDCFHTFLH